MLKRATCLFAGCALFLAACGESVTAPEPQLDEADVELLTKEVDAELASLLDGIFEGIGSGAWGVPALAEPRVRNYSWEKSRDCRAGGTVSFAGSGTRTWDAEARTYDVASTGSRTRTDCAFVRGDVTITLNGSGSWTHERHYLKRAPTGTWNTHWAGSFNWAKSTGETGNCSSDLNRTIDTAANTVSLTGTYCGREVDRSRTWKEDR